MLKNLFLFLLIGETVSIPISLNNETPVSGFQFNLIDNPDILTYVDIVGTDRTATWTINANEVNNEIITLGFDFSGIVIEPGEGPILFITLQGNDFTEAIGTHVSYMPGSHLIFEIICRCN